MRALSLYMLSVLGLFALACDKDASRDAVAEVNGHEITLKTFEEQANRLGHIPGKNFDSARDRKELLDEIIQQKLLYQTALKEKLPEKSERLQKMMAQEYLNEKIGRERYEPTEDEVKAYYEAKKTDLEKVRVSHILIKPKDPNSQAAMGDAKRKAQTVLQQAKAGADFAKLAKQHSEDDANKDQGGDLMYFERSKMVPEFSNAAFALKKIGDISDIVATQYGFHIIKLTGEQRGLDMFQSSIKWQLAQEKRKQKAEQLLKQLKDDANIKIHDDVLAKANLSKPMDPLMQGNQLPKK